MDVITWLVVGGVAGILASVAMRGKAFGLLGTRDDLQRLQLQKEQLISFLVHDLKNPINGRAQHPCHDPNVTRSNLLDDPARGNGARA